MHRGSVTQRQLGILGNLFLVRVTNKFVCQKYVSSSGTRGRVDLFEGIYYIGILKRRLTYMILRSMICHIGMSVNS